jgi:hypothetical protein
MSPKIVVEESPGLYVSEVFFNLLQRNKKPQTVEAQAVTTSDGKPLPAFNPAPLREFLRVMNSSFLQKDSPNHVKQE